MHENQLAKEIVDAAYQIHTKLGPGLFELVYEVVLVHELQDRGLAVERQKAIPIRYEGLTFDEGFRADIIVNNSVFNLPPLGRYATWIIDQLRSSVNKTRHFPNSK